MALHSLASTFLDMIEQAVAAGALSREDIANAQDIIHQAERRNLAWEIARAEAGIKPRFAKGDLDPDEPIIPGPPSNWLHDGTEAWSFAPDGKTIILDHGVGYRCTKCNDVTWVTNPDLEPGHPEFGKVVRCTCYTDDPVYRRAEAKKRLESSGIPGDMLERTFDSFVQVKGTEQAYRVVMDFVESHRIGREHPRMLVLYGTTGAGKTHLIISALQVVLTRSDAVGTSLGALLEACKADQFAMDARLTAHAVEAPFLALDEFGSGTDGDWGREKAARIVNARLEANRWTILGMTATSKELDSWSKRISSRLASQRHVVTAHLRSGDYRRTEEG